MAKADFKGTLGVERIKNFGGICHSATKKGSHDAFDICNFRILPDGTLEKREGFTQLFTFPNALEPRAFISTILDGEEMMFFVCENRVYEANPIENTIAKIGEISTVSGRAELFICHGFLYVMDENDIYRYEDGEFNSVHGYVPLYGRDLDGIRKGEVFEDVNYLSDRLRFHFKVKEFTNSLYLGIKCSEICSVTSNGKSILSSANLSQDGMSILLKTSTATDCEIDVCVILAPENIKRNELVSKEKAVICDDGDAGRIILYGGAEKGSMLISKEVSNASYLEAVAVHTSATEIYFPISDKKEFPCSGERINNIIRAGSKMLIFGDNRTAELNLRGNSINLTIYDEHLGSTLPRGAVMGGEAPFVISHDGIYRLGGGGAITESGAECISSDIEDMLTPEFFERAVAFYDKKRGEAYFGDPESDDQEVFVYSVVGKKWYRFDGIPYDFFFSFGGKVCMAYGGYVFNFSEDELLDRSIGLEVSSIIEAYYESNPLDFSLPERLKHIGRAYIRADCDGNSFDMTLLGDSGGKCNFIIADDGKGMGKYPTKFNAKTGIGRFLDMNYIIRSNNMGRTRIMSIVLSALK